MREIKVRGFTFIELMLAVSIFAIVAVAIYSTFGTGISAWKKAQVAQNLYQDIRLALDKMGQELENASLYSENEEFLNFEGKEDLISFYSLVETFQTIPVRPELKKIAYSLKDSSLQRLEETFTESVQESRERKPEEVISGISSLSFSYCYIQEGDPAYKWKDVWEFEGSEKKLPQGIKIELELDREENLVFTKYVFIPTGVKGEE